MGLQARKARELRYPASPAASEDGPVLDATAVLDTLELSEPLDDDADPVRGIACGLVLGSLLWAFAIVGYSLAI